MAVKFRDQGLEPLYLQLAQCSPRGLELATVLERRNTRLRFAPVRGGFTLNVINTIFLEPLPADASEPVLQYWVSLLAHEACHIEQGFIVDSMEQEVRAYASQCTVAQEVGLNNAFIDALRQACANVDPTRNEQLEAARQATDTLLGNQPATMLYKALPLAQPVGLAAIAAAAVELSALAGTLFMK